VQLILGGNPSVPVYGQLLSDFLGKPAKSVFIGQKRNGDLFPPHNPDGMGNSTSTTRPQAGLVVNFIEFTGAAGRGCPASCRHGHTCGGYTYMLKDAPAADACRIFLN